MANDLYVNAAIRDHGGQVFSLLNSTFGGKGDGTTVEDAAFLNALDLIPAGSTLLLPATVKIGGTWQRATYLFDAVDMNAVTAKADIQILSIGAILKKRGGTGASVTHMFKDTKGAWDGLRWHGGKIDLNRTAFSNGDTVSFFFGIRNDDIQFKFMKIFDGIEEGLKLYKPRQLTVLGLQCLNIRNDGVQIHTPDEGAQYTGTKPDRGAEWCWVTHSDFDTIDDGLEGLEGQAVAVSASSSSMACKNVWVENNRIKQCVRGPWGEFNTPSVPGENINFNYNIIYANRWFGIGIVGCVGSTMIGNKIRDIGVMAPNPPQTASETAGMILSGSANPRGQDNVVAHNTVIESRSGGAAFMQYGLRVINQIDGHAKDNRIRGATVKNYYVEWGANKVERFEAIAQHVPALALYRSNAQTVANDDGAVNFGPDTLIKDSTTLINGVSGWSVGANSDKLYFRAPGLYKVYAHVQFGINSTGYRRLRLYTDDGTTATLIDEDEKTPRSDQEAALHAMAYVEVTEAQIDTVNGYFIKAQIYQNSGAGLDTMAGRRSMIGYDYIGTRI